MVAVKVQVTNRAIITALNTPGGDIYRWRDEIGREIEANAIGLSMENDPLNATHRGEVVGLYKAGWSWDRRGSQGHHVIARVTNREYYAYYIEWGRSASSKMQIFSWTEYDGGLVRVGGPGKPTAWQMENWKGKGFRRFVERAPWETLPKYIGKQTGERPGQHVLGRAVVAALGGAGITARVDM